MPVPRMFIQQQIFFRSVPSICGTFPAAGCFAGFTSMDFFFSKNDILSDVRVSFDSNLKQHFEGVPGDHVVFIGHAVLPLFLCISLHSHLNALLRLGHNSVFAVGLRIFPSTFSQIKHIGCATFVSRFFLSIESETSFSSMASTFLASSRSRSAA